MASFYGSYENYMVCKEISDPQDGLVFVTAAAKQPFLIFAFKLVCMKVDSGFFFHFILKMDKYVKIHLIITIILI